MVAIAALLAPIAVAADEDAAEEAPPPPPVERHWYDGTVRGLDIAFDIAVIRPLALVTLGAGAALSVPAFAMTAPNGWDSIKEVYDRLVREPGEYFYSRPLGEF